MNNIHTKVAAFKIAIYSKFTIKIFFNFFQKKHLHLAITVIFQD
jgi:hypothetical protein